VRHPPRRLLIQTRSPLIERDLDVIGRLGERAIASITLETDDGAVRALGIGELYERLGFADWFKPGAELELLAAMRARLGDDRVLFSRYGFNAA
jgi:hypothetical protein